MLQPWMIPGDLAPGDSRSRERDWSDVMLHRITSPDEPAFGAAFQALWDEFGARGELEQASVLSRRLRWDGSTLIGGAAFCYDLMQVTSGGRLAAVRDHTAIVRTGAGAVVHLSHNLIVPEWRRSGLAGWMRALPIQTARNCLRAQGIATTAPIALVGEMEHAGNPASYARLAAYEKAGFQKIDPRAVNYLQPDFRAPEVIDAGGGPQPLPLALVVRRVGRELERTISGAGVREIVESLYCLYGAQFRNQDMTPLLQQLESYPAADARIALLPPTADVPLPGQ